MFVRPEDLDGLYNRISSLESALGATNTKLYNFLDQLSVRGVEHFDKYYGIYRAFVADNRDPEKRGRIKVIVAEVGQTTPLDIWIDPIFDYAGTGIGTFFPPEIHLKESPSTVRVFLNRGNPSEPIGYFGGWYGEDGVPSSLGHDEGGTEKQGTLPIKRGIHTKAGHFLVFNDKKGSEDIKLHWSTNKVDSKGQLDPKDRGKPGSMESSLEFTPKGNIVITDAEKTTVTLDADKKQFTIVDVNKNKVTMKDKLIQIEDAKGNLISIADGKIQITASTSVTIKTPTTDVKSDLVKLAGESYSVPLGQMLLQWLDSHTHPTGVGPSGPPIVPTVPTLLSQKVKLS